MKIQHIMDMQKDGSYERWHVEHDDSKGFITSTEGFWDQTEYPIIDVKVIEISSKTLPNMWQQEEQKIEVACLIYSEDINESVVDKTLTTKEIVDKLLSFGKPELQICSYADKPYDEKHAFWYFDCINMYPSDDYDCRCDNIATLYKGYHTEAFLS